MYKPETIAKYRSRLAQAMASIRETLTNQHVSISFGNRKIGHCLNVSLAPIATCGKNCHVCLGICYDLKACLFRTNVMLARARNTVLAMEDRDRFFVEIDDMMRRRRKNRVFRWHVGGDIPDYDYFCRMVENAKNHPDFIIWTYTKQYGLVNRYIKEHGGNITSAIPDNMSIMYSVWNGLECDNPYGFATFECVLDGHEWPEGVHRCNGACKDCIVGKTGCPYRKSSAVAQH